MKSCAACEGPLTDGASCTVCNRELHFHCAGITEAGYRKLGDRRHTWRCGRCRSSGIIQTPLSSRMESDSVILKEIRVLADKLTPLENLKEDLTMLRTNFLDVRSSLNETHKELKDFNDKLWDIEKRLTQAECVKGDLLAMQIRLEKLEEESNAKDQWNRMNNVEIKGIHQTTHENLFDIVNKIGVAIDCIILKNQINFINRAPPKDKNKDKPIILSFCNRYTKENFIAAARLLNKMAPITAAQVGLPGNQRIYINDHLTLQNKLLLLKTKKAVAEGNFRYVWVKHSTIYARKDDTSHIIIVKTDKDLEKIK